VAFIWPSSARSSQVTHTLTVVEDTIVAGMAPLKARSGDQVTSKFRSVPLVTGTTAGPGKPESTNLRVSAPTLAFAP
jgi:hypothetical protein